MERPQRTDPAADDPAEEQRHDDGNRGQAEKGENRPGGDECRHGQEGIEVEEGFHPADVIRAGEPGSE